MSVLFDTNVLIDFLRDRPEAVKFLSVQPEKPCISVASALELYAGVASRREEQQIERLFEQAKLLPVSMEIAKRAGVFVRVFQPSHSVEAIDAIIAATAEHHGLRLATLNTKHFPMFPKLKRAY
jgi:predicted nucleic acid-binding protein